MSFASIEESRNLGLPIHLYKFTIGNTSYTYTDCDLEDITFNDEVYARYPIDRDSIIQSGTLDNQTISITLPITVDFGDLFLASSPTVPVAAQIFVGHENDPDKQFISIFVGRVVSVNRQDHMLKIMCETAITNMKKMSLRRYWQISCCHALYDSQCAVDKRKFTTTATVVSASSNGVTLNDKWNGNYDPSVYQGGVLWFGEETRSILQALGSRLILSDTNSSIPVNQVVNIAPGCGKTLAICNSMFNNGPNFGGQPWIPLENPAASTSYYY